MRKKRLIILSSILSVFAVMIILASTVFMLRYVEVDIVSANNSIISESDREDIIKSAKFKYGGNVLFMNFNKQIENIETSYPYVKVEKIERKFPNKAIVHISERTPAAYAKVGQLIYVLDKDLKVLNVVYATDFNADNISLPQSALLVPKINIEIEENVSAGLKINDDEFKYILESIISGLLKSGNTITELSEIAAYYEDGKLRLSISTHNNELLQLLVKGRNDLATKVYLGIQYYSNVPSGKSGIVEQISDDSYNFTAPSNE